MKCRRCNGTGRIFVKKNWAYWYGRCRQCFTKEEPHMAKGLCYACYMREYMRRRRHYYKKKHTLMEQFERRRV